jgi:hypothetical protein
VVARDSPMRQEQKQEQEQQQKVERKYKIVIPIIYNVTHPGRALETRTHYQRDINRFLAYFEITNIEPLRTRLAAMQGHDHQIHCSSSRAS